MRYGIRPAFKLPTVNGVRMGRYKGEKNRANVKDPNATVTVPSWRVEGSARPGAAALVITSESIHINRLPMRRRFTDCALVPSSAAWKRRMGQELTRLRQKGVTDLDVVVDSEGGVRACWEGITQAIRAWKGRRRLLIDGACSSAATILLCGVRWDCVTITRRSHITVHNPTVELYEGGRRHDRHRDAADKAFLKLYRKRTERKAEIVKQWIREGKTFTAMEAVVAGWVDEMKPRMDWETHANA